MPFQLNLPDPNDESYNKDYDEKDFPPNDSYSDIFSLFRDIYYGFHQIILTIIVLISSHFKFRS